jgi:hypothetical protein
MSIMRVYGCAALASILLLTACKQGVDLAGVRTLAATVKDAEPSYTALADDYYATCQQSEGWQKLITFSLSPSSKNAAPPMKIAPVDRPPPSKNSFASPPAVVAPEKTLDASLKGSSVCDSVFKPVTEDWNRVNGVVIGYIAALGAVAGGQRATDFGLGNVTSKIQGLTSAQGSALNEFLNAVANEVFNAKRRSAISQSAPGADAALQTLVKLQVDAANNYKIQLLKERGTIDSFYRTSFSLARRAGRPQTLADEVQWQSKLDEVDKRSAAADAYVASVRALATHHRSLIDDIENDRFDQVYAISVDFVTEFKPKVLALSKAFS